jgi:hypothetical protein
VEAVPSGPKAAEVGAWYNAVRRTQFDAIRRVRQVYQNPIELLPELERDIDGLAALEEIAARLDPGAKASNRRSLER